MFTYEENITQNVLIHNVLAIYKSCETKQYEHWIICFFCLRLCDFLNVTKHYDNKHTK